MLAVRPLGFVLAVLWILPGPGSHADVDPAGSTEAAATTRPAASPAGAAAEAAWLREQIAQLPAGDHDTAMILAEMAIDQRLLDEADALYRGILAEARDHEAAHFALWQVSRGRALRKESPTLTATLERVPEGFHTYETSRYMIITDADPGWINREAYRLTRAYDQFIRFANRLDLRPLPLRHKLVAVVFSERDDFVEFARRQGNEIGDRLAGYYDPRADHLVFYHVESDENVAKARARLEAMWEELDAMRKASRRAGSVGRRDEAQFLREEYDAHARTFTEQEHRVNAFALRQSISVTIHEAIHQLMFHTDVQSPSVEHPLWLSEGLATAFETDAPRAPFGPSHEYGPRRESFYHLMDNDRLIPLSDLVGLGHQVFHDRPEAVGAVYSQGYALVSWLCRHERAAFRRFLRRLNATEGRLTPERHVELFEESFGSLERIEQRWLRYEAAE